LLVRPSKKQLAAQRARHYRRFPLTT